MTEIVLLHHIRGLTTGVLALADTLRAAGHTVHTPDLFDGRTFGSIEEGAAYAGDVGFATVRAQGVAAVGEHPGASVVAGISMGVVAAQEAAQTLPGIRAALLYEAFVDPATFGSWPDGVAVQVHGMDADPFFAEEGDLAAARAFAEGRADADVFDYPGSSHLFLDASLESYDPDATALVVERSLDLLGRLG
ncbi:dienelactone hydrolase family protein [Phycicoccus sp. BSK3Z-2]|uniref:Dienelactone hydrolase family protein n=1 Tax=Phycicoccus avicenniae TaxID=2828860 RepID=A0A941I0N9_9MICO|nr:dienelactone hydrolase family protein [Phycicoccus avicenniae]MBR7744307.1 dienelactone hydrolase family protein [Phycicoccus avicenniae]